MTEMSRDDRIKQAAVASLAEARISITKESEFHNVYEGYGMIKRELDELWMECNKDEINHLDLRTEARHLAAMTIRFYAELTKLT